MGNYVEKISMFIGALVIVFVLSLIFTWPIMLLWNWLMPVIFNLPEISFWQTFGLMILCSLLFKSNISVNNK